MPLSVKTLLSSHSCSLKSLRRRRLSKSCNIVLAALLLGRSTRLSSCMVLQRYQQSHHRRSPMREYGALFSTTSSTDLVNQIWESYHERETDGVLDCVLSSSLMTDREVDLQGTLVPSILAAADGKQKGSIASIMNAMIGSCCFLATDGGALQDERDLTLVSGRVEDLLFAYEEMDRNAGIAPDIVSYSLAYTALRNNPDNQELASNVLETALQRSKKKAGSKRRKTLAALRRKPVSTFKEAELELKQLLGNSFELLAEGDGFAVINKPSGVPCFHLKTTTAGKIKKSKRGGSSDKVPQSDISLEDALISCNVPLSTLNPDALGLVHRLDRWSSGCLVLAKTDDMHAQLMSEFFLRRTTKTYVALLRESSRSCLNDEGVIEQPVHGRPAKTKYKVIERNQLSGISLVEFEIFTGRKHQIRVHAAESLFSPVLNDGLYDDMNENNGDVANKPPKDSKESFFLHARRLTIPHLGIDVEATVPSLWQDKTTELRQN
jgi:23S rRNA-/tRNA-specific pseudouridylate synthase